MRDIHGMLPRPFFADKPSTPLSQQTKRCRKISRLGVFGYSHIGNSQNVGNYRILNRKCIVTVFLYSIVLFCQWSLYHSGGRPKGYGF